MTIKAESSVQQIFANDRATNDRFGFSVSIYDKSQWLAPILLLLFLVACIYSKKMNKLTFGHKLPNWMLILKPIVMASVAQYLFMIVIGAYLEASGTVYIFESVEQSEIWTQAAKLSADGGVADAWFVVSVSIHDQYVVIGACEIHSAYIFERDSQGPAGIWTQSAQLTACR
eukprot:237667_1